MTRINTKRPTVFGLPLTSQTWLLLGSGLLLLSLVALALVDWLSRA